MILLKTMIEHFKKTEGTPDILIVAGDVVAHGIAATPTNPGNFTLLKEVTVAVYNELNQAFPETIILPTLGNNDVRNHYLPPSEENKTDFYTFIYDIWFAQQAHKPFFQTPGVLEKINQTMMEGGYYRVDIDDDISILTMNTLYFDLEAAPYPRGNVADVMLDWYEA